MTFPLLLSGGTIALARKCCQLASGLLHYIIDLGAAAMQILRA
jgi:hypothetical protein